MNKFELATICFLAGIIVTSAIILHFVYRKRKKKLKKSLSESAAKSKVVYKTDIKNTVNYLFPTHDNLLVMDRSDAEITESFIVRIAPGKFSHRHIHYDTEQLYYILSGTGRLEIERSGKKEIYKLEPEDFVHVPRNCYHQTFCEGRDTLKYLAIDCFPLGHNPSEPTWDSHARTICKQNNWDYSKAVTNVQ